MSPQVSDLTINCVAGGEEPPLPTDAPPVSTPDAQPTTGATSVDETPSGQETPGSPEPTEPATPSDGDDDGGSVWIIFLIIGIIVAIVAAGGAGFWYFRMRETPSE